MLKSAVGFVWIMASLGLGALSVVGGFDREAQETTPVWATSDRFWFRTTVQGGHEWWKVDVVHGLRERLFDHRRLAIELGQQTKREFSPLQLPFSDPAAAFVVKYDGSNAALQEGALAIEFTLEDERWRCELQGEWDWGRTPPSDYYCESQGDAAGIMASPPLATAPVQSPDGKWEALVQNHNVAVRPTGGAIKALSSDGSAADAYHLGSVRWSPDSRTVTAYRVRSDVWRSYPVAGSVKAQITKGEWKIR